MVGTALCIRDSIDFPDASEGQGPPARGWQLRLVTQGAARGQGPFRDLPGGHEPGGAVGAAPLPQGAGAQREGTALAFPALSFFQR